MPFASGVELNRLFSILFITIPFSPSLFLSSSFYFVFLHNSHFAHNVIDNIIQAQIILFFLSFSFSIFLSLSIFLFIFTLLSSFLCLYHSPLLFLSLFRYYHTRRHGACKRTREVRGHMKRSCDTLRKVIKVDG